MTISLKAGNTPPRRLDPVRAAEEQDRRKNRLMAILSKSLPTLPMFVLDLNALLRESPVDLKKVGKVIRSDASLTAQVLRICNSAMFGLRRRVINIEQASVLIGVERIRTLVLTCSVMQFANKRLDSRQLTAFWQHSFMTALLSERIAKQTGYFEKEQAYLGGLLHDIGLLPLWMLVVEEATAGRAMPPDHWPDNVAVEREYFGMDHCKVGRSIAVAWNFMPSFFDVFEFHHAIHKATHDPYLAGIVAVADQFLATQSDVAATVSDEAWLSPAAEQGQQLEVPEFIKTCLPALAESECVALMDMLRTEYVRLLPIVQIGMNSVSMGEPVQSEAVKP